MDRKCMVTGCGKEYLARGFCSTRWAQWKRGVEGLVSLPSMSKVRKKCKIRGCPKLASAKRLCGAHYRVWRRENNLDPKQSKDYIDTWGRSFSGRWSALKRAARVLGIGFDITKEQHLKLLKNTCHYCKGPINPTGHALDRKNNFKGYLLTNVVTCCYSCNKIKSNLLTYAEMVHIMKSLLNFRRRNNGA